jgi:hypothetical protein
MRNRGIIALLVLAVLLAGCASGGDEATTTTEPFDPAAAAPGPYIDGAEVFIVYPDPATPTGVGFGDFRSAWDDVGVRLAFPALAQRPDGPWSTERFDNELRVALDAIEQDGEVLIAQLSVENRATDAEDAVYVDELIPGFLTALGVEEAQALLALDDVETLYDEARTQVVEVDGLRVSVAVNRWALVLGVSG